MSQSGKRERLGAGCVRSTMYSVLSTEYRYNVRGNSSRHSQSQVRFAAQCPRFNLPSSNRSPPGCLKPAATSAEEARVVAASLVDANLKGYDSHGVMRVPYYVQAIKDGEVVPGAELTILDDGPSRIVADGNWGLGQVQAMRLIKLLAAKAHAAGLGLGTMMHSGHIGRLGEYCEKTAADGLVSMLMVNSHGGAVRVAPPGGKGAAAFDESAGDRRAAWRCAAGARLFDQRDGGGQSPREKDRRPAVPEGLADRQRRAADDAIRIRCMAIRPARSCRWAARRRIKDLAWGLMIEILTGASPAATSPRRCRIRKKETAFSSC